MASPAQWSPFLGRSATVRSVVVVAAPRSATVDGPVTAPRGTAISVREKAAVPRIRSLPLPFMPNADIPEVGAPSQCPHAEQKARWSALSCAQCLQVRIAVVSLLYPWYRFDMNAA